MPGLGRNKRNSKGLADSRLRTVTPRVSGGAAQAGGESSPGPAQTAARSTGSRGMGWGNPVERSCRRLDRPWPGTELPNKRRGRDGDVGKSQSRQSRPPSSSGRVLGVQQGNYPWESICDKASFGEVGKGRRAGALARHYVSDYPYEGQRVGILASRHRPRCRRRAAPCRAGTPVTRRDHRRCERGRGSTQGRGIDAPLRNHPQARDPPREGRFPRNSREQRQHRLTSKAQHQNLRFGLQ
jgi:hypothetical protein